LRVERLDYTRDSALLFEALRSLPWPVFLDSGQSRTNDARFDILAADPTVRLLTRGAHTEIRTRTGATYSSADPLALVEAHLGDSAPATPDLPFAGGAIGYFAYDLGRLYEPIEPTAQADIDLPELVVGIYDWALVVDHVERKSVLVTAGRDPETERSWDRLIGMLSRGSARPRQHFEVLSAVRSTLDRPAYHRAFARVQEHIRRGDVYQINLTQRFDAEVRGDGWAAYRRLRDINPAPYSAFLDYPFGQIMSSSPERFLHVAGAHVETKPIKGTRPRHVDPAVDRRFAEELAASPKDRAENVMIVDLLRNDLGKTCIPGSIEATKIFEIEHFANVHHMVSTIEGELSPGYSALDLLRGCFPGGSITGAPKVRAMQIIESLEPHRRSVYCGAIGYVGFDRNMDTNIAIRTLVRSGNSIFAWAGGGIVADSDENAEYQECLDKASGLLEVIEAATVKEAG